MNRDWRKEAVVYQIYPISFKDSNGDGMGDLKGIIQKLDYLTDLGVDIVWISPYFSSPYIDNGYDISDYENINPLFGTLEDWDNLIEEMHKRGLKMVMDLVVNHCSNQHRWFLEAQKSKDNPYRDYFIWRDAKPDGSLPNNWTSYFSGPAWEYSPETGQYYLHLFSKEQPDLNWENPKLRQEIYSMMHFWLKKGVDGFRLDVMHGYGKTKGLPDGKTGQCDIIGMEHFCNLPFTHQIVHEMNREVFSKYDVITVGETGNVTPEDVVRYTAAESEEVNMVFQFQHVDLPCIYQDGITTGKADMYHVKKCLILWQSALQSKGWNSLYLSNHDQPRQVSKFGDDKAYRTESAKMLATIMHLQQGTPYIYQGEEIGMTNRKISDISEAKDIMAINLYHEKVGKGLAAPEQILAEINAEGRDNARTPMQWDASDNAGFTDGTPWICPNPNYRQINVENELKDPNSVLHYYKKLIALRKENPVVVYGDFKAYCEDSEKLFVFTRTLDKTTLLVIANMTGDTVEFQLPDSLRIKNSRLYISNYEDTGLLDEIVLRPYEVKSYLSSQ